MVATAFAGEVINSSLVRDVFCRENRTLIERVKDNLPSHHVEIYCLNARTFLRKPDICPDDFRLMIYFLRDQTKSNFLLSEDDIAYLAHRFPQSFTYGSLTLPVRFLYICYSNTQSE